MIVKFTLLFIVSFVVCNDDINIENIKKFMSQSPEDLAKTLQLLENPYIATALVNDNKKERKRISTNNYPIEESNNLLNFLLTKRLSDVDVTKQYKIEKPQFPLVPPTVDAKGIEKDPLLASFFLDTMEDQAPLENARNTDVPSVKLHQRQREVNPSTPLYHPTNTYYYIPPTHFQQE